MPPFKWHPRGRQSLVAVVAKISLKNLLNNNFFKIIGINLFNESRLFLKIGLYLFKTFTLFLNIFYDVYS